MLVSEQEVPTRAPYPGGISVVNAPHRRADPKVGFIAPVIVDRLVEATEGGAATTSAPLNPRGRSAKGRASAGGVVTG
jgi:hypothetical protein